MEDRKEVKKVEVTVEGRSVGTEDRPETQAEVRDWVLVGSGGAGDFWEKIGVGTGRRETETQTQTQTETGDRW